MLHVLEISTQECSEDKLCACLHPQPGPYSQPAPGVGMWKMKGEPENTGLLVMAEVNRDKRHNGIHSSRLASDGGR